MRHSREPGVGDRLLTMEVKKRPFSVDFLHSFVKQYSVRQQINPGAVLHSETLPLEAPPWRLTPYYAGHLGSRPDLKLGDAPSQIFAATG